MTAEFRLLIKDLRQAQDLSQDELARELGISRQSIISLEQGAYLPSFPILINLILFFNCDLDELVEGLSQNVEQLPSEASIAPRKALGEADWSQNVGSLAGAINIYEADTEYEIQAQLPGFKETELSLEFTGDTLTISGEIKVNGDESPKNYVRHEWDRRSFSRSIRFDLPINESKVEAKLADGTLTIHAPKIEPVKPKTTKITVKKS